MKTYRILDDSPRDRVIDLPPSKSLSHRALILAALNPHPSRVRHVLDSDDLAITRNGLTGLGAGLRNEDGVWLVSQPIGLSDGHAIELGNSGSSARFLIPLGAFADRPVLFQGTPRLHERPFGELFSVMKQLGYRLSSTSLPVTVEPWPIRGGIVDMPILPSSQVISGLMMAALRMEGDLHIRISSVVPSFAYVDMTSRLMQSLGIGVEQTQNEITVEARTPNRGWDLQVEKDMSAASYWALYALLAQRRVLLRGLRRPTLQGDEAILDLATMCGATVDASDEGVAVAGAIDKALDIDARSVPDLVPTLGVLAMFAPGETVISNIEHLRHKESDRIESVCVNIRNLGGHAEYRDGSLRIRGRDRYRGTLIRTFDDHRIAMAFAMAGVRIPGVTIENPDCVTKSYPGFWKDFENYERCDAPR